MGRDRPKNENEKCHVKLKLKSVRLKLPPHNPYHGFLEKKEKIFCLALFFRKFLGAFGEANKKTRNRRGDIPEFD